MNPYENHGLFPDHYTNGWLGIAGVQVTIGVLNTTQIFVPISLPASGNRL